MTVCTICKLEPGERLRNVDMPIAIGVPISEVARRAGLSGDAAWRHRRHLTADYVSLLRQLHALHVIHASAWLTAPADKKALDDLRARLERLRPRMPPPNTMRPRNARA